MNKTANEIGLKNSHFKNPHGLNQDNHYSSLRDLALLSSKISNDFPEYLHYFSTDKLSYNDNVRKNHNPLIKYNYQGATGMKTGMTRKGGYGMVGTAKRGSKKLIAVTNNLKSSKERREVVTAMLDYGFNDYTKVNILNKGDEIASAKTWLGKKNDVDLIVGENVQINIQNSQMSNDINLEVNYESPIYAPILKGQKIANLIITIADKKIKEVPLFAKENIDKTSYFNRIYRTTRYKFYQFLNILK
jgi:D-alanyl-D-alanine carboxypeptidase (penicillin-binding protein 5/6)